MFRFLKCFGKSYRTIKYIKIDIKYVLLISTQIKEIILIKKYSVCLLGDFSDLLKYIFLFLIQRFLGTRHPQCCFLFL